MKTKTIVKVASIILSVCMLVTMFTCLMGLTVSAANTDMIVFDVTDGRHFLNYRPTTGEFEADEKYLYSFDLHYTNDALEKIANGRTIDKYWRIQYVNTSDSVVQIPVKSLNIVMTELLRGHHYDITFTAPSDCRDPQSGNNISIFFGEYDSGQWIDQKFKVGNLDLWKIDSNGDKVSQIPLTIPDSTGELVEVSGYNTARSTGSVGNWAYPADEGSGKGGLSGISIEAQNGYFDPMPACTHESKHLVPATDSTCSTPGHDDYYACDNCEAIFNEQGDEINLTDIQWELDPDVHEDELPVTEVPSTCKTPGHTAYIACSGCGAVLTGSNDPLPLDPDNHAGEGTEVRDIVKATDHSTGYSGDTYCLGCGAKLAEGEETPIKVGKMLHFPAVGDNYQVIVYKMAGTFPAGVYRFTVDELAVTGIKSSVSFRVKSPDYGSSVEKVEGSDVLDTENNKRTVEFQLWGAKDDGAMIMIGNYGNGADMETYYANPEFYLLDDEGNPTGENLLEGFYEDNSVLKTGTSRKNAAVGKWTTLNWSSERIILENYNPTLFGAECAHYTKSPVAAKASTCTTQGNIDCFACDACGAYFDAEGNALDADQVLLPLDPENHEGEGTEKRDYVKATLTTNGYSGDTYCLGCGECIDEGKTIYAGSWVSKMITWGEGARGYSRVMYRPGEGAFEAGATYRYSFDMEIDAADANEDDYWKILYRVDNKLKWDVDFAKIQLNFETDVVKTQLAHGYHYEVTFTVPAECLAEDNILLTFGDRNMAGIPPLMRFANIDLWKLDGEGNKTEQIVIDLPALLDEIIPTSDGFKKLCGDKGEWYTVENYNESLDLVEQNGYFAPLEGCEHANTYTLGAEPATCVSYGHTGTVYCADCYAVITEDEVLDMIDHTLGDWLSDEENHWHVCETCSEEFDKAAHTASDWIVDTEATAEADGHQHKECTVCGRILEEEDIPALAPSHVPGDINGDAELNNKDLTRFFQYLSDWDVEVNEAALDVNGDGSVNNKDLTRLFQYLSDWDVEIF